MLGRNTVFKTNNRFNITTSYTFYYSVVIADYYKQSKLCIQITSSVKTSKFDLCRKI